MAIFDLFRDITHVNILYSLLSSDEGPIMDPRYWLSVVNHQYRSSTLLSTLSFYVVVNNLNYMYIYLIKVVTP